MKYRLMLVVPVVLAAIQCGERRDSGTSERGATGSGEGMQLLAVPIQHEVPTNGALPVEVTILNQSNSVVRFQPMLAFGDWLDAEITDSTGNRIVKSAMIDGPNALTVTLLKGQALTDTIDIRCGLEVSATPRDCMAAYDGLSVPGRYHVRMHFTLPCSNCEEQIRIVAEPFTVRVARDISLNE